MANAQRQQQAPPRQDLQTPNFDDVDGDTDSLGGGESFESFAGSSSEGDEVQRNIKQIVGRQLSSAVVEPLAAAVPLLLNRRPAIVAPAVRGPVSSDESEESSEEEEESDYNPWRDNFYDLLPDGSYVYGYSLPNGVRRYERSFYSEELDGQVVEGFYTQPRQLGHGLKYELRCYRSDINGYKALPVEFLRRPPRVERDERPDVDCFDK
ncbi:uncharacterized protein LOC115627403 [Scaptodrosophila lebanonensis]|uniref:Uncharacterized protein LOC115627403 n=1 Tax=Drosophila lebanonensis TaxID=7225 RepID=A0A6J2TVI7_DROLE|nr:uncharacterized protein LOC115627403 [Scaptodrosophila lebanonensis]